MNRMGGSTRNGNAMGIRPGAMIWTAWVAVLIILLGAPGFTSFGREPPEPKPDREKKEDLGERLIRKAVTDEDEDVMDNMIRLMDESAKRLEIHFDSGERTQHVQDRILRQLEEAIQQAASMTRSKSRSTKPSQGERRSSARPDPQQGKDRASRRNDRAAADEPPESTEKGSPSTAGDAQGGELRDIRRTWGHLPQRERDEVIQGVNEKHLERFRAWIERYYQALQEAKE